MKGIYAITDSDGRVYYVGQSKNLEVRAYQHLNAIKKGYPEGNNKMYWLLGNMFINDIVHLQFQVLREWEDKENVDLRLEERKIIQMLKPVLNSQVPDGCLIYMRRINSVVDAVTIADENGRWRFGDKRIIWG